MDSVNKHIIVGFLGNDPKIQQNENGYFGAFNVATNDSWKDSSGQWQTNTDWHRVKVSGWIAEKAFKELKKGSRIYVSGKSRKRQWTNNEGVVLTITEIHAEELLVLDPVNQQPQQHQQQQQQQSRPQQQQSRPQQKQSRPQQQPQSNQNQDSWVSNPDF